MVVPPIDFQGKEEESNDLDKKENQPVEIHPVVDSSLNDVFVIFVNGFGDPVLELNLAVDVGVIVE